MGQIYKKISSSSYYNYYGGIDWSIKDTTLTVETWIGYDTIESGGTVRYHTYTVDFNLKVGYTDGGTELGTWTNSIAAMSGANSSSWGDGTLSKKEGNSAGRYKTIQTKSIDISSATNSKLYINFNFPGTSSTSSTWGACNVTGEVDLTDSGYIITFIPNNGDVDKTSQFVFAGNSIVLQNVTKDITYNAVRWSDGTKTYSVGEEITPTSNMTLGAIWNYRLRINYNGGPSDTTLYVDEFKQTTSGYGDIFTGWTSYESDSISIALPLETTTPTTSGNYLYRPSDASLKLSKYSTTTSGSNAINPGESVTINSNTTYYAIWTQNVAKIRFTFNDSSLVNSLFWKYSTSADWTEVTEKDTTTGAITITPNIGQTIEYYFNIAEGYQTTNYSEDTKGSLNIESGLAQTITVEIVGQEAKLIIMKESEVLATIYANVGSIVDLSSYTSAKTEDTIENSITAQFILPTGAIFNSTNTNIKTQEYDKYWTKSYAWVGWMDAQGNTYDGNFTVTKDMLSDGIITGRYASNYTSSYRTAVIDLEALTDDITYGFTLLGWFNETGTIKLANPDEQYIYTNKSDFDSIELYGFFDTEADPGIYIFTNGNWKQIFKVDENNFLVKGD